MQSTAYRRVQMQSQIENFQRKQELERAKERAFEMGQRAERERQQRLQAAREELRTAEEDVANNALFQKRVILRATFDEETARTATILVAGAVVVLVVAATAALFADY